MAIRARTLVTASVAAALLVIACAPYDDDPAALGTETPAPAEAPGDKAPPDETRAPVPSQCAGFTRGSPFVASRTKYITPPEAFGGPLRLGTYDLTELVLYDAREASVSDEDVPPPSGTEAAQVTLIVTEDALHLAAGTGELGLEGFAGETLSTAWYHVEGTNIVYEEICPTRVTKRIPFLTVGGSLVLLTRPDRAEFYTLR